MTNFVDDLENWMTKLPVEIRSIPIINLAIPGSHDSMSYGISTGRSSVAPDATPVIDRLYKIMPCVVKRWAITQKLTATQQLRCGIRYFDLRICLNSKDNFFYFVHGLYCEEITTPLTEIKEFLESHRGEFVVLDCQHFYNFSDRDFDILAKQMLSIFQNNIYSQKHGNLTDLTLKSAESQNVQLLIIYRSSRNIPIEFWPSDCWPTPWPNQIKISKLENYLEASLQNRSPECGFVTQCVVTPPVEFIVPRFFMSLRRACADKVRKGLFAWIKTQKPGKFEPGEKPTSNVFIADFVDLKDNDFCKIVIGLNEQLLAKYANVSMI